MMRCYRPAVPAVLTQHGPRWTERFVERRAKAAAAAFAWPRHEGQPLNEHLLPLLMEMTARHCVYCDHFELGVDGARATIDHFRPKGDRRFWALAFTWSNLFPCCDLCQAEKAERFCEEAPSPDAAGYNFEYYFVASFRTGEIIPNPAASAQDQERARATIEWLGLNRCDRPRSRRRWYELFYAPRKWFRDDHPPIEELPYRFLAPPGGPPVPASGP